MPLTPSLLRHQQRQLPRANIQTRSKAFSLSGYRIRGGTSMCSNDAVKENSERHREKIQDAMVTVEIGYNIVAAMESV